jgi:O-antigen ligase
MNGLTIGRARPYGQGARYSAGARDVASVNLLAPAFLVGLALSPLIFGGNVPLAWGVNALVFGLLLSLYAIPYLTPGRPWPVPLARFRLPAICFGGVLIWIAFQAQTWWVPDALAAPAWRRASELLGEPLAQAISVNPGATWLGLLRLATAAAVFLLALEIGRDVRWAGRIIATVAIAGALHAVYAMGLAAIGAKGAAMLLPSSLFNLRQDAALAGTFINRNHFAIYLGLSLLATWGLFLNNLRKGLSDHGYRGQREALAKGVRLMREVARFSVLMVPLTLALLMTGSRAGLFLTLAAMLVMLVIERRAGKSSLAMKAALAVAVAGVIVALAARGDVVGAKLAGTNAAADLDSRLGVGAITLRAIAERPVIGHGYGTFANVFPVYRDDSISLHGKWLEAHNSFLEAILGLGLPMALLLFAGFAALVFQCISGAITRKRDRLASAVAVGATLIVACHALVDFSIQLQGVALSYAALLGAGYAQSWTSRET